MPTPRPLLCLLAGGASFLPACAGAQTAPRIVSPSRPDQAPVAQPVRGRTPTIAQARNPDTPITPFVLRRVVVDGTSLPLESLQPGWQAYLGQTITTADLAKIVNAVAARYAKADIALYTVLVPEQRFGNGDLRLLAVEGYVGSVEVRGSINPKRKALLQAYFRRIERQRPLRKSTLERTVSQVRDLPGFTPDLTFERGTVQGEVKLAVKATDKRVQFGLGINDRGTAFLGRTQIQADAFANAVLTANDQLRATIVVPTEPRLFQYYALAYSTGIGTSGVTLSANASYLRTRPKALPLTGDAYSFGFQASYAALRRYRDTIVLTGSLDGIDSNNALFNQTFSNDRVRSVRGGVTYSRSTSRNFLSLGATASFGLAGLGARVDPGFADRRYRKVNARVAANQQVGRDMFLRLNGYVQGTDRYLPSSEQIALGGDEFGRAYEASIISGDYGYAGSGEVAYHPQSGLPKTLAGSEAYVFLDGGRTFFRDRAGGAAFESHLASVGGGVRARFANRAIVQVEAVRGLTNPVFYEDRKKWRALFSVKTIF